MTELRTQIVSDVVLTAAQVNVIGVTQIALLYLHILYQYAIINCVLMFYCRPSCPSMKWRVQMLLGVDH